MSTTHPVPADGTEARPPRARRPGRHLLRGLLAGLILLAMGDRGARTADDCGIDPLDVLRAGVKNNVLFLLDTSGSMRWTLSTEVTHGGDDPASRFYPAKQAVLDVVNSERDRVAMGFLTYEVLNANKVINGSRNHDNDGFSDGPFLYVSADAAAQDWENFFLFGASNSSAFSTYDQPTLSHEAFNSFANRTDTVRRIATDPPTFPDPYGTGTPYPYGCTVGDTGQLDPIRLDAPSLMRCRFYLTSRLYKNNIRYTWRRHRIVSGTNDRIVIRDGVTDRTVTVPAGLYDRATLAAAVTSAITATFQGAGSASRFVFEYPTTPVPSRYAISGASSHGGSRSFNIQLFVGRFRRTAGAGAFTVRWSQQVSQSTRRQLGFLNDADYAAVTTTSLCGGSGATYCVPGDVPVGAVGMSTIAAVPGGCPNPPGNLLGDNPDGNGDGLADKVPACVQFQDQDDPARIATFYYSSAVFVEVGGVSCGGAASIAPGARCDEDPGLPTSSFNITRGALRQEIPVPATGVIDLGLAPSSYEVTAATGGTLAASFDRRGTTAPPAGVRAAQSTPIAGSLSEVRTTTAVHPAAVTGCPAANLCSPSGYGFYPPRPVPVQNIQRNFLIILTDGDDTCAGGSDDDANSVLAAAQAYSLFNRNTTTEPQRQAMSLVIAYGPEVTAARADRIARAGSGGQNIQPDYPCPAGSTTCRDAYVATTVDDLKQALRNALALAQNSGEFSASPSIVGSVFEQNNFTSDVTNNATAVDPRTRYNKRANMFFQSSFELNGWRGRLRAYRNDGSFLPAMADTNGDGIRDTAWDVGQILDTQALQPLRAGAGANGAGRYTFLELHNNADLRNVAGARLPRRIFTSPMNGTFTRPTGTNSTYFDAGNNAGTNVVPLWPPAPIASAQSAIGDIDPGSGPGPLDDPLGIGAGSSPVLSYIDLRTLYGACLASASGGAVPAACDDVVDPVLALATARKESRQIILAFTAGAQLVRGADTRPVRSPAGELLYQARAWPLADNTLAAPAVVGPPLRLTPSLHQAEWQLYRDGRRDASRQGLPEVRLGYGLRNPDADDQTPATSPAKPVMTVVFAGFNDAMLHAFKAATAEEMWAFVPYDQLGKLRLLAVGQQPGANHVYGVAAPVRVGDVFIPGAHQVQTVSRDGQTLNLDMTGRWRTVAMIARGPAGKHLTAIDVTAPGTFPTAARSTYLPWIMWSRGNPDTVDGTPAGSPVRPLDTVAYSRMGETWSVPALGRLEPRDVNSDGVINDSDYAQYPEWRAWCGSGCTDVGTEGSTFYELDVLSGNVLRSVDVGDGAGTWFNNNTIMAGPAAFNPFDLDAPGTLVRSADVVKRVYFPDVKGRIFKYQPTTGNTGLFHNAGADQPIANSVALLRISAGGQSGDYVFAEAGNDDRVNPDATFSGFQMLGVRDTAGDTDVITPGTVSFTRTFPTTPVVYRGTVQPATVFNAQGQGRVFFAGTAFVANVTCLLQFNTFLYGLGAVTGNAVYDFNGDSALDAGTLIVGTKAQNVTAVGGQVVLGDSGGVGRPPGPPPTPAATPSPRSATPPTVLALGVYPDSSVCRQ